MTENKTVTVPLFIREYRALQEVLRLKNPVISYPACGTDISLAKVFPESETYYIDTDANCIELLRQAHLPAKSYLIRQSAYEYAPPDPVDLVVLRAASTDAADVVGLVRGLKQGGYVIESHWGSSSGARKLLADPQFKLIGRMEYDDIKDTCVFDTQNVAAITQQLIGDTDVISKYAGKGYVFQKIT
ncbi:hypothetical protein HZC27_05460 [Candidatus Roizmanbacteria bacterium]|nr:hypothetical protein [Candidatus Roizmanbacteria bacterium]